MNIPENTLPKEALKLLEELSEDEFKEKSKILDLSKARKEILFKILKRQKEVDHFIKLDIQRYALKFLFPDIYAKLSLGAHLLSSCDLYEYDPPKNGQNIMKHGITGC